MIYANQSALQVLGDYVKREEKRFIKEAVESFESKKKEELDRLVGDFERLANSHVEIASNNYRKALTLKLKEDIELLDKQLKDFVCNLGLELVSSQRFDKFNYDINIILNIKE